MLLFFFFEDDVSEMFSMLFIACHGHTEHGGQPGAGALAAGGRAPPKGQRRGGTTACMLRGVFEVVQVKIEIEIYRGVRTVIKKIDTIIDWIERFGSI